MQENGLFHKAIFGLHKTTEKLIKYGVFPHLDRPIGSARNILYDIPQPSIPTKVKPK